MTKADKITFWIIEFFIIVSVAIGAFRIWNLCHEIPEINTGYLHKSLIWPMRFYRCLPTMSLSLIVEGTIMNLTALYCVKLKSFKKSSFIDKILFRLCASMIVLILSCITLILIPLFVRSR